MLALLGTGATNRQIARNLFISERTVGVHVSRVLHKLQVTNRAQAAAVAVEGRPVVAGRPRGRTSMSPFKFSLFNPGDDDPDETVELDDDARRPAPQVVDATPTSR